MLLRPESTRPASTAEEQAYGLLDLVLTPLVRGDATGRSLLADRLPSIIEVVPSTDSPMVRPGMTSDDLGNSW